MVYSVFRIPLTPTGAPEPPVRTPVDAARRAPPRKEGMVPYEGKPPTLDKLGKWKWPFEMGFSRSRSRSRLRRRRWGNQRSPYPAMWGIEMRGWCMARPVARCRCASQQGTR
eukprot:scaffold274467_cov34-Tisochrysis_lutea.AAC.5